MRVKENRFASLIQLLGVLLLAWALRIWNVDAQSFWNDEAFTVFFTQQGWDAATWSDVVHPPLFFYLMHLWGAVGTTEGVMRFLPVASGMVAVVAVYALGRRIAGTRTALLAALFAALAPLLIWYSHEMRPYMTGVALSLLSLVALVRFLTVDGGRRQRLRDATLYVLFTILSCLTLYFAGLIAIAGAAWVVVGLGLRRLKVTREQQRTWLWTTVIFPVPLLLWMVVVVPKVIPLLRLRAPVYGNRPTPFGNFVEQTVSLWGVGPTPPDTTLNWLQEPIVLLLILLAGFALLHSFFNRKSGWALYLLLFIVVLPPALLWLVDQRSPNFNPRYIIVSAPALYLLAAAGVVALGEWAARVTMRLSHRASRGLLFLIPALAAVLVASLWWPVLQRLWHDPAYVRDNYRGLVEAVVTRAAPSDALVLDAYWQESTIRHFAERSDFVAPLYGFPTEFPLDEAKATQRLNDIAAQHTGVWLILYGQGSLDPKNFVERWLDQNARRRFEEWYGTARVVRYDLPFSAMPSARLDAPLGPLTLHAYETLPSAAVGQGLPLKLAWQLENLEALQQAPFSVSLRLRDEQGQTWVQRDHTLVQAGEYVEPQRPFIDAPRLTLPAGTPSGTYELEVVVYNPNGVLGTTVLPNVEIRPPELLPALGAVRARLPRRMDVSFGEATLVGSFSESEATPPRLRPGEAYQYDLLWLLLGASDEPSSSSWTLRVELVDGEGNSLVTEERPLALPAGLIRTKGAIPIPMEAGPGIFAVRLTVLDEGGQTQQPSRAFYWNDWAEPVPLPPLLWPAERDNSGSFTLATLEIVE